MHPKPRVSATRQFVTVVSDQIGHWIRQASRGSRRGGLVTVHCGARFVHTVPTKLTIEFDKLRLRPRRDSHGT